jgi:hypothetical protein
VPYTSKDRDEMKPPSLILFLSYFILVCERKRVGFGVLSVDCCCCMVPTVVKIRQETMKKKKGRGRVVYIFTVSRVFSFFI